MRGGGRGEGGSVCGGGGELDGVSHCWSAPPLCEKAE